jgi:protein arginine N-methyltransferase 5
MSQALYLSIPTLVVPAPSLANRAHLPSYARAIANLLQIGGAAAYTQVVVRIPISDPTELIQQGPAGPVSPGSGTGAGAGAPTMAPPPPPTSKAHKRISSLSTRPQSFHQSQGSASGLQPFTSGAGNGSGSGSGSLNGHGNGHGMRTVSGASAFSQASSVMSARSTATVGGTAAGGSALGGDPNSTWEMWDTIRAICGYHPRLSVSEWDWSCAIARRDTVTAVREAGSARGRSSGNHLSVVWDGGGRQQGSMAVVDGPESVS